MDRLKVMVTKGLRGRTDPEAYHKRCISAVLDYYTARKQLVEILSFKGVSNTFDGSTTQKRLVGLGNTLIHEVAQADVIVFMDEWHHYDGCVVEHLIALRYGIPIVYLSSEGGI